MKFTLSALIAVAVTGTVALAQDMSNSATITYAYPSSGVQIGQGWDSFEERGTGSYCINVEEAKLEKSSFDSTVEQIQSRYTYIKKTTSSVSASYNGGSFGASGSGTSSKSLRIDSDDQNFLFTFTAASGSTFAAPPGTFRRDLRLTEDMAKIVESIDGPAAEEKLLDLLDGSAALSVNSGTFLFSEPSKSLVSQMLSEVDPAKKKALRDQFRKRCGDAFVVAVHRGARLNLLLTQKVRSRQQKESLVASIGASGYGASGSASFSSARSETLNTDNLTYSIIQEGGVPTQIRAQIPPSSDQKSKLFDVNSIMPNPDNLLINPAAISIEVLPYSKVAEFEQQIDVASPNNLFMVGDYYIVLEELFNLASEIVLISNMPNAAISRSNYDPDLLRIYGGARELSRTRDQIHRDLMFLHAVIKECFTDSTKCELESAAGQVQKNLGSAGEKEKWAEAQSKLDDAVDQLQKQDGKSKLSKAVQEKVKLAISASGLAPTITKDDKDSVEHTLNAVGLSTSGSTVEETLAYIKLLADQLRDFQEYVGASGDFIRNGKLSADFYLRFYHYAANLPIPKVAYQTDLKNLNDFIISYEKARVKEKFAATASAVSNDLRNMILTERLLPWKKFFCEELKDAPLCVPDAVLLQIATPKIDEMDFTVKPKRSNPALPWGDLVIPPWW
ncbi:hypothetical protein GFM44_23305 [Rhizobium leguminosarum bv. viciae]|nr:hypothetical protein [Rhizobium leguminosarum bv. viciae]